MTDQDIIDNIIVSEGVEYTNDPLDNGGPTKFGITLKVLTVFRGRPCTAEDVQNLPREEAENIYGLMYIRPFKELPDSLRHNVIDMGVNAGQKRAIILLQQLLGSAVDGFLGPQTVRLADIRDWNDSYYVMRISHYENIILKDPSQRKWRNGWRNRADRFTTWHQAVRGFMSMPVIERTGKAYAALD